MEKAGFMELDFEMFFEPDGGINTPREFTDELIKWAEREKKDLVILEESMEPKIKLDENEYVCRLGTTNVAMQNNKVWKKLGLKGTNQSIGKFLGYKWAYIYRKN